MKEKDRIIKIMEHENLTYSKFAETIGIQRPAMSHIISGRNNPSLEVLKKILETFTYIDPDWLMFGTGHMMRGYIPPPYTTGEPDLFSNSAVNPPKVQVVLENRKENEVQQPPKVIETSAKEQIIVQKIESKKVVKIMLFYSDETYDTFIPEKNKKD